MEPFEATFDEYCDQDATPGPAVFMSSSEWHSAQEQTGDALARTDQPVPPPPPPPSL